jgi:hypothetical protein
MKRAVEGLRLKPNKVLVDGNRCPRWTSCRKPSSAATPRSSRSRRPPSWPRCTATAAAPSCTWNIPQYGFAATRATARPSTWRRCACTAPASTTAGPSRRWRRGDAVRAAACRACRRSRRHPRATTRCSRSCAGWRRTAPPTASRAASGWKATTCAARRCSAGCKPALAVFRSPYWPGPGALTLPAAKGIVIADALFARAQQPGIARAHGLRAAAAGRLRPLQPARPR